MNITSNPIMKIPRLKLAIAVVCIVSPILEGRAQEAAATATASPTVPAGRPRNERGSARRNPFLAVFDTNGDGVIDEKEMAAAAAALKKLDKNGDGKITEDELRAVMPGRAPGGPDRQAANNANNVDPMVDNLMKFDKNGDGKLSMDELPDRLKSLMERGDTNKDGFLTRDELQKLFQAQNKAGGNGGGAEHQGEEDEHDDD